LGGGSESHPHQLGVLKSTVSSPARSGEAQRFSYKFILSAVKMAFLVISSNKLVYLSSFIHHKGRSNKHDVQFSPKVGDYPPDLQVGNRSPLSPGLAAYGYTTRLRRAVTDNKMMIIQSARNAWYPCRPCSDVTMKGRTQLRRESI